jgi:hypothetical protein
MRNWGNFNFGMSMELGTTFSSHQTEVIWIQILFKMIVNLRKVSYNNVAAAI